MCKLTKEIGDGPFYGYKVVAEDKNGKYWSIAMGFCYNDHEMIPKVKRQRAIAYYRNNILDVFSTVFECLMEGRSAVFVEKEDAITEVNKIKFFVKENTVAFPFKIKIIRTCVSDSIYKGFYRGLDILAGRKLEFLE